MDIGGSNVRTIIYYIDEKKFSDINTYRYVSKLNVNEEISANVDASIEKILLDKSGDELIGIGISLAACFERDSGIITKWPNNPKWNSFPILQYLKERFHVPVMLEDDANCAALGEQAFGSGRGVRNFVYITISTGIGCGIVINNELLLGEHGLAGEFGHIWALNGKRAENCSCGGIGCLQTIASGKGILKRFHNTTTFKNLCSVEKEKCTAKKIFDLSIEGNPEAQRIVSSAGYYLGREICNLVMLLDVPLIILGGGVIESKEAILPYINQGMEDALRGRREVQIICSDLKGCNGLFGAVIMAEKKQNKCLAMNINANC